jgi:hypothetical protein
MEPLFVPWNVDCEYDRAGMVKKYLQGIAQCDEQRETDAICLTSLFTFDAERAATITCWSLK